MNTKIYVGLISSAFKRFWNKKKIQENNLFPNGEENQNKSHANIESSQISQVFWWKRTTPWYISQDCFSFGCFPMSSSIELFSCVIFKVVLTWWNFKSLLLNYRLLKFYWCVVVNWATMLLIFDWYIVGFNFDQHHFVYTKGSVGWKRLCYRNKVGLTRTSKT